jgi:hypothetical protein
VDPVSLNATTALAARPLLQTHGTPVVIPGVRRDSRHVVTLRRSGHRYGVRPGVVRPTDSVDYG